MIEQLRDLHGKIGAAIEAIEALAVLAPAPQERAGDQPRPPVATNGSARTDGAPRRRGRPAKSKAPGPGRGHRSDLHGPKPAVPVERLAEPDPPRPFNALLTSESAEKRAVLAAAAPDP
jgi:hypothetical protein